MIELHETEFFSDGTSETYAKTFSSKWNLLKLMKKRSAMPTKAIYDLNKKDEAEFTFQGTRRTLKIVNIDE